MADLSPLLWQAEANKKSRDWTIGMAAYDQVLAKLGTVAAAPATAGRATAKKRKEAAEVAQAEGVSDRKGKRRKQRAAETADAEPVSTAAEPKSSAAEEPPAAPQAAAALSSSSHLARFGRRRAGKNVRRCACIQSSQLCHAGHLGCASLCMTTVPMHA